MAALSSTSAGYPVSYDVPRPERYNRWTVGFRLIIAIPQLILFGGGGLNFLFSRVGGRGGMFGGYFFGGGVLSAVLTVLVFFAWWAIVFTATFPTGMRDFCLMLFRWEQNVHAYMALLTDPYPPFSGHQPYPVQLAVEPSERHNRWTVGFRWILAIPHFIVLFFLDIAQFFVTILAWFAILFTG
ncbi:MAG TPA: DUF4389 domain-containing protein, partial [Dehalococcoidia bacterium]